MSPIDLQEFALRLAVFSVMCGFLGALAWGMFAELFYRLSEYFSRKQKVTPARLLSVAAALRKRSSQIAMQAESLRVATLRKDSSDDVQI